MCVNDRQYGLRWLIIYFLFKHLLNADQKKCVGVCVRLGLTHQVVAGVGQGSDNEVCRSGTGHALVLTAPESQIPARTDGRPERSSTPGTAAPGSRKIGVKKTPTTTKKTRKKQREGLIKKTGRLVERAQTSHLYGAAGWLWRVPGARS